MRGAAYRVLAAGAVLFLAAYLRVFYLQADLPAIAHPDEPTNITVVQTMLRRATLNPQFFNYPSLYFYLNLPGQVLIGLRDGALEPIVHQGLGRSFSVQPAAVLAARLTSLVFGHGLVALVMRWTSTIGGAWAGIMAGMLAATNPLLVRQSVLATPDMIAAFFAAAAVFSATALVFWGSARLYILSGALAGLAASSKYNLAVVVLAIVAAHLMRAHSERGGFGKLSLAAGACLVAFFATSPFILIDVETALAGILFEISHYGSGHPGAEGDVFWVNAGWLAHAVGWTGLLAVAALGMRSGWILVPALVFVLTALGGLMVQEARFERNLTPIIGPILVAAALGAQRLAGAALTPVAAKAAALALVAALSWVPLNKTLSDRASHVARLEVLAKAQSWIRAEAPNGTSVAVDAYVPWFDVEDRTIASLRWWQDGTDFLLHRDLEWITSHDVAIVSRSGSGRFVQDGTSQAAARLAALRDLACEVSDFGASGGTAYLIALRFDCG